MKNGWTLDKPMASLYICHLGIFPCITILLNLLRKALQTMHLVSSRFGHLCCREMRGAGAEIKCREEQRQPGMELLRDIISQEAQLGTDYNRGEPASHWVADRNVPAAFIEDEDLFTIF